MFKKLIVLTLLVTISYFYSFSSKLYAQNQGTPVFQTVAEYTVWGGLGGAGLGAAYWLTDPLDSSKDLRETILVGFGIGAIAGFLFSLNSLYKKAIIPGRDVFYEDGNFIQSYKILFDKELDPAMNDNPRRERMLFATHLFQTAF